MSSVTDNNVNEMLERRQTRSGTPLDRSSVERTSTNQKKSALRQRTRAQTGNEVSTITEVIETHNTEVVFTENSVASDTVDFKAVKGRQKKSVSVERTKSIGGATEISTYNYKEPQLYKATRRLFDQEQTNSDQALADSTTRESQVFDYSSYSSDDGSGKPVRAYDIYKRAGEYWNVFPKTDFTYSPSSQDRREIAPGVINIPNMSRRSIHQDGEHSRLRSPTRFPSLRRLTTTSSSSWNATSTLNNLPPWKLKYWSNLDSDEDEVDSELKRSRHYASLSSRQTTVRNFFTTYLRVIWTVLTTFCTRVVERVGEAFGNTSSRSPGVHSRHISAVDKRSGIYSKLMSYLSTVYDFSFWIVTAETWLLIPRFAHNKEEDSVAVAGSGRKNRKLLWLMLIPFLMLAGIFLFQETSISLPDIHLAVPDFIYDVPSIFHRMFRSLHAIPDFIYNLPEAMYHVALKIVEVICKIPSFLCSIPELLYKLPDFLSPIPGAAYGVLESFYKIFGIFPHTFFIIKETFLSLF